MPRYQFDFEAIHADWPVYPVGHGVEYALETLCCFPVNTHFKAVDDIDKCILFVADEYVNKQHAGDEYSEQHLHVALWHDDLRELRDRGWVAGFRPAPTAKELRQHWVEIAQNLPIAVRAAAIEHARSFDWETAAKEDETQDELGRSSIGKEGLCVAATGWSALWNIVQIPEVHEYFSHRVSKLLGIGLYDSAVREAAILLESDLRKRTNTTMFGQNLLNRHVADISKSAGFMGAFQRHLRSELRTFFTFIRNEFAHNIFDLERERCYAMLRRISCIYEMLDEAGEGAGSFQDIVFSSNRPKETRRDLVLNNILFPYWSFSSSWMQMHGANCISHLGDSTFPASGFAV